MANWDGSVMQQILLQTGLFYGGEDDYQPPPTYQPEPGPSQAEVSPTLLLFSCHSIAKCSDLLFQDKYFISRSISLFQLFLLQVTSAPVFAALSTTSAYNPTPLPELTNLDVVKGLGAEDVTKALERQLFNFPPSVTAAFTGEFYLLDKEEQPLLLKPNVAWSRDKSQSLRLQKSCVRTRLSSPGSSLLR